MLGKLKIFFGGFFASSLAQQVKELYSSTLILNFAAMAISLFEPVFLYLIFIKTHDLAGSLQLVLYFYLVVYALYFVLLPLGAKIAKGFGYEHTIALSTVFMVIYYACLFAGQFHPLTLWIAAVVYAIDKALYWPAYHADFARFSNNGERGREISNLTVLNSAVEVIGPLGAGFILKFYDFKILFILASVLIFLSNIPMLITKEKVQPKPFPYFEAYKRLFSKERRRYFWAYLGFGEELIAMVIWPIFIYLVVGDFLGLGLISGFSIILATAVYLYIGHISDKHDRRVVLRAGSIFYFFGWLFRLLARTVMGIFMIDSYSRITKQAVVIPMMSDVYQEAKEESVMGTVVFFEMALTIGKILAMLLSIALLNIFVPGWNALFILAGVMSLLYLKF